MAKIVTLSFILIKHIQMSARDIYGKETGLLFIQTAIHYKTRANCSKKVREIQSGSWERWLGWQGWRMIICKRPDPLDEHLQEAGSSGCRGEREFPFPVIPKNEGLWFPFPNFRNGFFHSLPVPEFREWIFFIPFPFPIFGNGFFSFPSRSRTLGMDFFHSLPVPELTL